MNKTNFKQWLEDRGFNKRTIDARISNCNTVEKHEGNLEEHFLKDEGNDLIHRLSYSTKEQKEGAEPKHRIPISGDVRTGSATLKQAVKLYMDFKANGSFNIPNLIQSYKTLLKNKGNNDDEIYKWRAVQYFQDTFDIEAEDFSFNFKEAIKKKGNLLFQNSWGYIIKLLEFFPEEGRHLFKNLYNESQPLEDRFHEFIERSINFLPKVKEALGRDTLNHQQDERTLAFYMAMKYPDRYFLYKDGVYQEVLRRFGVSPVKTGQKYFHFTRLLEQIREQVVQDNELLEMTRSFLDDDCYKGEQSYLITQDIVYQILVEKKGTYLENKSQMSNNNAPIKTSFPLNQILFGPPGTGKTYSTIDIAAKVIGFDTGDHDQNLAEFNNRLGKNIEFVTFHQSFSYEDFIEGIKPIISTNRNGEKTVIYDIQDGVFKKMAIAADKAKEHSDTHSPKSEFEQALQQLKNELLESDNDEVVIPMKRVSFSVTDIGNHSISFRKSSGGTGHTLVIDILKKIYTGEHDYGHQGLGGYYNPLVEYLKSLDISNVEIEKRTSEPFLIIIDEINRGNVSEIFGELITLIETNKRAGNNEALSIVLPYSKRPFSVPDNLYIIGTMNTADRSVEALDTALRRRFAFIEKAPDATLLNDIELENIDFPLLLETINNRIEKLLNKDYMIGHAYFLSLEKASNKKATLKDIFADKILPLLQEYFYGNFGKIQLVLGKQFVEKKQDNTVVFAESDFTGEDYQDRDIYHILNIDETDIVEAVKSIYATQ